MKRKMVLILLFAVSLCMFASCALDAEVIDWVNIKIGHILPEPQSKLMKIVTNSDEDLLVYVHNISLNEYLEYQRWCEYDKGFSVEKETVGDSFYAYNEEGYYLTLYYVDNKSEMHITLKTPIPMEYYELPEYAIEAGLPVPLSKKGHYNWQEKDGFYIFVGETSKDEYMRYKDQCVVAGFVDDPYEYDTVYSATNSNGYKVSLHYRGFNIFTIEFRAPKDNIGNESERLEGDRNLWGYILDYADAESFEKALNDGENVENKIVRFDVVEYKPDSAMGINCWSGEHLNFISENELNVKKGDIVIGRVTSSPINSWGSWKIYYEPLVINGEKVNSETPESTEGQNLKIILTMDADDFKGMSYQEAEEAFRKMGFIHFEYQTVDTDVESECDLICNIEIKEQSIGNFDFSKGDQFDSDSTVTFFYYVYKKSIKPSPVYYSSNDYETAQKGNTGVFSYKSKGGSYDVYWIIDFDEGYVYYFTEGNGNATCDKVKIVSGDLNSRIEVTWHDGSDRWTWYLHFRYVNNPLSLIVNDHFGSSIEFSATELQTALRIRQTKVIKEY